VTALAWAPVAERVQPSLDRFEPVDLDTLVSSASLQTRVDRKYLLRPETFEQLLTSLGDRARVLEIEGRRSFGYESVYFDTPDLTAYRAAAHSRRRRFKVRTRTYLDSGECVLEVKTSSGRGETVKERREHDLAHRDRLDADATAFVRQRITADSTDIADQLGPVLTTTYARSTLLDRDLGFRMTCDVGLVCAGRDGSTLAVDDHVLVETKSAGPACLPDRLLWASGCRPVTISKYCVGLAALHPGLPANKWHRTLQRHLGAR